MWRSLIAHKHHESGQAVVEFAIVLPILLLLVMGIIQFGFILNGQITVTSAARDGAREAFVNPDNGAVEAWVEQSAVALLLNIDQIVIDRAVGGDDDTIGVTVIGKVEVIVPFVGFVVGDDVEVRSTSYMRSL